MNHFGYIHHFNCKINFKDLFVLVPIIKSNIFFGFQKILFGEKAADFGTKQMNISFQVRHSSVNRKLSMLNYKYVDW